MRLTLAAFASLTAVTLSTLAPSAASADPYKWCAVYGGFGSTTESCYYMTRAQCQMSVSGMGGFCKPSAYYDGKPVVTPEDRPRRRS
jgi:hypothetical protein